MANKVAVIESEYTSLETGLSSIHEDCLSQLDAMISALQSLNAKGGGLYTEHLTPKIETLLSEIKSAKSTIGDVFSTSEELAERFQNIVDNYDTLC